MYLVSFRKNSGMSSLTSVGFDMTLSHASARSQNMRSGESNLPVCNLHARPRKSTILCLLALLPVCSNSNPIRREEGTSL